MASPMVRIIKFDADGPTDRLLARLQTKLHASSNSEAMTRSLDIVDQITDLTESGQRVFVQAPDGQLKQIIIS